MPGPASTAGAVQPQRFLGRQPVVVGWDDGVADGTDVAATALDDADAPDDAVALDEKAAPDGPGAEDGRRLVGDAGGDTAPDAVGADAAATSQTSSASVVQRRTRCHHDCGATVLLQVR